MASLLKKFVDTEQWDAEDIAGRLGMVLHAAFLLAGFQPYGAQPRSGHLLKKQSCKTGGSLCLSRQYTVPDIAQREGADSAVLMLCVQGDDVALLVFLTTDGGDDRPENMYLERLDLGTVRPLLAGSLDGVEPRASWICRSLANVVCWGFLDELCRSNGLSLLTGFTSLPDDLKVAVLKKLTDVKDLARVECVSSQLRLLVAERDHELWKPLFRRYWVWCPYGENYNKILPGSSWKYKYKHVVESSRRSPPSPIFSRRLLSLLFGSLPLNETPVDDTEKNFDSSGPIEMIRRRDLSSNLSSWPLFLVEYWLFQHPTEEEVMVSMKAERSGGHRRKLEQNDCKKKWNGGGTIHSSLSRY